MTLLDELLSSLKAPDGVKAGTLAIKATERFRWIPNPGPQTGAYFSEADELFYGGAAGGGKTDLILGLALNTHLRSLVLRREGTDLRGIEQRAKDILGSTAGYNATRKEWRLGAGQTLELGSCVHEKNKFGYQGRPHDLKAFDEITQFSRAQYDYIIGWNRTTKAGQRCRVVVAGNPPATPEGQWVKECWAPWLDPLFADPAAPGELRWFTTIDGKTRWVSEVWRGKDEDGNEIAPKSRTFIPAKLADNPELTAEYRAKIQAMPEPLRTQLLYGDFNVAEDDQANQVIPAAWVRAAQARWTPDAAGEMLCMGADIAQGGEDETALSPYYEFDYFGEQIAVSGAKTPGGPEAAALIITHLRNGAQVNVDMGGGFGQSTYDHLTDNNIAAKQMIPAGKSDAQSEAGLSFVNKRAEWWWRFREALDPKNNPALALPPCEKLTADLCAPRWKLTPRGIQVEEKDKIKKRLGRSPDRGDSIVMAFGAEKEEPLAELSDWPDLAVA